MDTDKGQNKLLFTDEEITKLVEIVNMCSTLFSIYDKLNRAIMSIDSLVLPTEIYNSMVDASELHEIYKARVKSLNNSQKYH